MKSLHKWHQTKSGLLAFGLIELAIAYGFASLAINDGSLWVYLLTLIFFIGALQNFAKLIGRLFHGRRKTS